MKAQGVLPDSPPEGRPAHGRGSTLTAGRPRRGGRVCGLALLALVTFVLRVPTLHGVNFTPDAAEYAGIARRVAEGRGSTTALKWNFLDSGPVVRPAIIERPLLYPLFGSLVLRASPRSDPLRALQAANAVLAAANAVLAVLVYRTVVATPAAWLAGGMLSLSPPVTQTSTQALSEQLFLLLWLAGLGLLPRLSRPAGAAAFGVAAGMAMLTRPNGALLLLPCLAIACAWEDRRAAARALLWALVGMLPILLPWAVSLNAARGGLYRAGAQVNFVVPHIHQAIWHGFGQALPTPWGFIVCHSREVASGILQNLGAQARALNISLGPLLLLLPAALSQRRVEASAPGFSPPKLGGVWGGRTQDDALGLLHRAWLLAAGANAAFYAVSWAAAGALRYLLPTTAMLLPLLAEAELRALRKGGRTRALALGVLVAGGGMMGWHWNLHRHYCRHLWEPAEWERYEVAEKWIRSVAGPEDVVASNNPWMVSYLTQRPAISCPHFPPGTDLATFARRFGVRWVVLFCPPGDPRVRHCRQSPAARLAHAAHDRAGQQVYLFAVSPVTPAGTAAAPPRR